ncbi:MAG: hypothetical protein ACI4BB_05830 [Coprococcus sp.]
MERIINFDQFYYTNYGQGMRFEGDSSHDRRTEKELELLTADWMRLDTLMPVESVVYNTSLGSYVAAMVVSCTKEGDARTSYWIHAVMPQDGQSDGFRECMSWPLSLYQKEVRTGQDLPVIQVHENNMDPHEACRKYGLTGERLVQLMYMVWQTVCGQNKPSTLCFIMDDISAADYNETARTVMSLVYDILPKQCRHQADYQAWSEKDIQYVRFVFKRSSESSWKFYLDPEIKGADKEIPEEERAVLETLAALYEKDDRQYRAEVEKICLNETAVFEDMIWQYYLNCLNKGREIQMSQETLIRSQPYLEQRAADSEDYRRLFCCCLHHVDTKGKPMSFVQTVMEKYILAAAALSDRNCKEYENSLDRNWKLLDQLRAGSLGTVRSYLEWMREISDAYYQDFVDQGLSEGRTWLFKLLGSSKSGTSVSCGEMLRINRKSMDNETQNLWLKTMAGGLENGSIQISSADEARHLYEYISGLDSVRYQTGAGSRDRQDVSEEEVRKAPNPEDMGILLSAVWQYEERLELDSRFNLCRIARYTSDMDFDRMSSQFWMRVQPEDFDDLYRLGPVSKVFESNGHPNYCNYRLYAIYRTKNRETYDGQWKKREKENFAAYIRKLHGDVQPAVTAIWQFWQNNENADTQLMYDTLLKLMEEDVLETLLKKYASKGRAEADRLEALQNEVSEETEEGNAEAEEERMESEELAKAIPWMMAVCIGLYMGLMVNGWYMAVHLAKLLNMSALVWCGVVGIAALTVVLIVLAERLIRKGVTVELVQIPWAGLWLFMNLVMSYFIGNKATALISGVILLAIYIWLRLKKYL